MESRRAGNRGCPCCRGELEQGLTPEPTAAENRAAAEQRAISIARGAALDSAVTAMLHVRQLLSAMSETTAPAEAVLAASATSAASATQAAVAGVLTVVRSPAPSLAMYETASNVLQEARAQLCVVRLTLNVAEAREARRVAEEAVAAAKRKVQETRRATRNADRAAATEEREVAEGSERPRTAIVDALLAEEAAKDSLVRMEARETDAVETLSMAAGVAASLNGGGGDGGSESP